MDAGAIMGLVIISITALIMLLIGICQMVKKDEPVGFYNIIDPPKKDAISDIAAWNKLHGMIWVMYGICIETGYFLAYLMPNEILEMIFTGGGVIFPLPFMVMVHKKLVRKYGLSS